MGGYWYFLSTLPSLLPGAAPPFGRERFLELCSRFLSPEDLAVVRGIVLVSPPEGPPPTGGLALLDAYFAWERGLREELAQLRARKLGVAAPGRHAGAESSRNSSTAALVAFHAENPLEGELAIERARWAFLDGAAPLRSFDLEGLVAWYLKLLSLERLAGFAEIPGEAGYRKLYTDILEGWRSRPANQSPMGADR